MRGSGLELHDELKERFGLDRGIVRSYRVSYGTSGVHEPRPEDLVTERLIELGEETTTAVGTGRPWVIDVERRGPDEELRMVERWSMFGYRSDSPRAQRTPTEARDRNVEGRPIDAFHVSAEFVRSSATAHGVQVAVHHDIDAARAAGARDIFLDTATQVALFGDRAAARPGGSGVLRSIELRMRAPICAGDTVEFLDDGLTEVADPTGEHRELRMRAVVGGLTVSSAVVAFRP